MTKKIPDPVTAFLARIGRKGGSRTSAAKTAANKRNAQSAGRPVGSKDTRPRKNARKKR